MMTNHHNAHVTAWVKHHARKLSRKPLSDGFKPQALHEYTDADGNPMHWRIRLKNPGTGEKWIRPLMRDGAGFALKQPDYSNGIPLYRLHELSARQDESVLIVEGETCADALPKLGILVTTSGAADSAGKADWSILAGRAVTVWPDNDESGQRYAEAVKTALVAIALEKHLPDSTMSRAVVFNMRRKLPGETVERLRHADAGLFDRLASMLARFADDYREQVQTARPSLPDALGDRAQDNWEPLLSVAQCAGAEWVKRATAAALVLSGVADAAQSAGNELLADIQHVFESKKLERIGTADLIATLIADDEAAWSTYNRGRPLAPRQLARMLAGYGIKSKNIRMGYEQAKGFDREQFTDAFTRYVSPPPENSRPAVPNAANPIDTGRDVGRMENPRDGEKPANVPLKPAPNMAWDGGTDKTPVFGSGGNAHDEAEVF